MALSSILTLTLAVTLGACSPVNDLKQGFDDYQSRLGRLLEVPPPKTAMPKGATLPPARDFVQQIPEVAIDLADLWTLRACDIARLISERNSILGKVQRPLIRFEYEIDLQREIASCIEYIEISNDATLTQLVEQIASSKQEHPEKQFNNLLFSNQEIRALFKAGTVDDDRHPGYQNSLLLLEHLVLLKQRVNANQIPDKAEIDGLKSLLERNYGNHYIGQLIGTIEQMITSLNQTSEFLRQNRSRLTCRNGKPNKQTEYLKNVLMNVYGKRIQPRVSEAFSRMDDIQPLLQQLFDGHSDNAYFAQFSDKGILHDLRQATITHSHIWQKLLSNCGLETSRS